MRHLFVIDTLHGQAWYDFFYFMAILLSGVLFLLDGRRRKYPMAAWSLIFVTGIVFFIIGTKLVLWTVRDWALFFNTGEPPWTASRSVLGGILLGTFGFWLARTILRFPYPVLDALAIGFPLAMAVQRLGCLAAGCCYGTPTDVPWGVTYPIHAPAFHDHLAYGWIDPSTAASLPVHPTQLYQVALCLVVAAVVWGSRDRFRRPGSLFFFSIGLYLVARFFVEFWNSPETAWLDGVQVLGLKNIQWLLLAGMVLITIMIMRKEQVAEAYREAGRSSLRTTTVFLFLVALVLLIGRWLTPVELLVVQAMMLPIWFFQLKGWFAFSGQRQRAWTAGVYALSLAVVFSGVLTGQQLYKDLTDNDHDRNTFYEITGGYGQLTYDHYHEAPTSGPGCNGGVVYDPSGPVFRQKQQVFGAGFKSIKTRGRFERLELSGVISAGSDKDLDDPGKAPVGTFDIGGGLKVERRWFGLGFGLHTGGAMHDEKREDIIYTTDHKAQWYASLSGSIRVFPYDIFYCEFRYNELMPYQTMARANTLSQLLIGSGLGLKNGTAIELGTDINGAFFIGGKAIINNTYGIRATIYTQRAAQDTWQVSDIGLIYRFRK